MRLERAMATSHKVQHQSRCSTIVQQQVQYLLEVGYFQQFQRERGNDRAKVSLARCRVILTCA